MVSSLPQQALDGVRMEQALGRLAEEILERNPGARSLALVGIRTRGVPLARRLARRIDQLAGVEVPVGVLDIALYRDDFSTVGAQPILRNTEIPFAVGERRVVLVDDVLYTGRTVRAALDGLIDFGRPRAIQLAVLVDRGHRELPIHADYVGTSMTTAAEDFVQVRLVEEDGEDAVLVGPMSKAKKRPASK